MAYFSAEIAGLTSGALGGFSIRRALQDLESDSESIEYCLPFFRDFVEFHAGSFYKTESVFIMIPGHYSVLE